MAIPENFKQSLIVAKQLPGFINNDESYFTFVRFIEAYYEWLENEYQLYDRSKNLLNYKDIDNTLDEFEEYFFNEFLQYFPKESLTNKRELVKLSKEFYQRKGTEASFKFLFRALYNSECEVFHTRKFLFIPSDGKWVVSKSIKINTLDDRFFRISNYKIVGETSKSIAKVERSQYSGNKIEIFLSDIEREFSSGEYIRVVDNDYNDVYIDGETLRAKIIGLVPAIYIDDNSRGSNYNPGDPVIIFGGLNPDILNPVEATAIVGDVTDGSISTITVLDGGYGYSLYPNTIITFSGGSGSGANAYISQVDNTSPILVSNVALDIITPYSNTILSGVYSFPSGSANANTKLITALATTDFITYPIKEITLNSGGTNYKSTPSVDITSYIYIGANTYPLKSVGICSPIKIDFGGCNYANGDNIILTGGSGYGAYANVKSVDANGTILSVQYISDVNNILPYGGVGYNNSNLPTVSINSANNKIINIVTNNTSSTNTNILYFANTSNVKIGMYVYGNNIVYSKTYDYFNSNTKVVSKTTNSVTLSKPITLTNNIGDSYQFDGTAILRVPSVLGDSASVGITIDSIGEIISLTLTSSGEDYIQQPSVSLKIMDIVVSNVDELYLPENGDIIYQGDALYPTFSGFVYSITKIPYEITYIFYVRVYNYTGALDTNTELFIDKTVKNSKEITLYIEDTYNKFPYTNGIKLYGDGNAKANVSFVSGTVTGKGQYLNSDGFPSSYCKLQGEIYNDFTYILSVEKALATYKNVIDNILHPSGTQMVSRNIVKSIKDMSVDFDLNNNNVFYMNNYVYSNTYGVMVLPNFGYNLTTEYNLNYSILTEDDLELLLDDELLYSESSAFDTDDPRYPYATNKLFIKNLYSDITGVTLDDIIFPNCTVEIITNNSEIVSSKVLGIESNPTANIIYLQDSVILKYSNVAYGYGNSNTMIISSLTGKFDVINNGKYKNEDHLKDIVFVNDYIEISNTSYLISNIDYDNRILYSDTVINYGNVSYPQPITIIRNFYSNNISIKYETGQEILI